jgi:hypothetical protein
MAKALTIEEIKNRIEGIFGDKYDLSSIHFDPENKRKVVIQCRKHGVYKPYIVNIFRGHGCKECDNELRRIKFAEGCGMLDGQPLSKVFEQSYSRCKFLKIDNTKMIHYFCPHRGFSQITRQSFMGQRKRIYDCCPICDQKENYRKKHERLFIQNATKIHSGKYSYENVKYIEAKRKVEIICPKHGSFWQRPNDHTSDKNGCPECHAEKLPYDYDSRVNLAKWKNALLYALVIKYEGGKCVKVGVSVDIEKRMTELTSDIIRLNVEQGNKDEVTATLVRGYVHDVKTAYRSERRLHTKLKDFKYKPEVKFGGHSECYRFDELDQILKLMDEFHFEVNG